MKSPLEHEESLEDKVYALALKAASDRAVLLSFLFAGVFGIYGITSIDFITRFQPSVALWDNIWPRLAFNTLPLLFLGVFTKKSKTPDRTKLLIWIVAFSLILHAAAWIHIWPIALWVSAGVLTYVSPANLFLFGVTFAIIAPPGRLLLPFSGALAGLFVGPLLAVAYLAKDPIIFKVISNDTLMCVLASAFLSRSLDQLHRQIARLKIEKELEASKFLGPVLSKAIFENESERLDSIRCKGFVISIDIRDSTDLLQNYGDKWFAFRKDYFALVTQFVAKYDGYIQKTVGDCHVINFGVMDYGEDLSEIPGIEQEMERAEQRRLQRASDNAFKFLDELFLEFEAIATHHIPERPVRLGAGIDKGWVERGVQGDTAQNLELDVNGDPVNCCSRLQEYAKVIGKDYQWDSSMIVISPFASDFLKDAGTLKKISTVEKPIRNYPGVKWVLVKRYGSTSSARVDPRLARVG